MTEAFDCSDPEHRATGIASAVSAAKGGRLVVMPTDTVYGIGVEKGDTGTVALIDMTLTSAACPLTDVIEDQTVTALVGAGLVNEIKINWVWNPPWGPDKITEDGREQLRALGFTV